MKAAGIIKAICWSLLAVLLAGIMFSVVIGGKIFKSAWNWGWDTVDTVFEGKEEWANYNRLGADSGDYKTAGASFSSSEINSISLDWLNGEIKVKYVEGNEFRITETSSETLTDKTGLRYRIEDGKLDVRYSKYSSYNGSWFRNFSKDITVEVPVALSELDIEGVSSDVDITGITAKDVQVSTVSGEITTKELKAESLGYETVSGSKELSGAFRRIDGDSVSGSTKITSSICPDTIDLESVSGSITVLIPENNGFRAEKSSASGSFSSNFEGSIQKDSMTYKNGSSHFNFDSVSGSVTVNRLDNVQ